MAKGSSRGQISGTADSILDASIGHADNDLAKFSADGASAFEDISLTRRALFEGRADDAKKFVALADSGFNKAMTDNTVCTEAEADLKAPSPKQVAAKTSPSAEAAPDAATAAEKKKPIAWVPIDGSITVAETITGDPAKKVAVADANSPLVLTKRNKDIEYEAKAVALAGRRYIVCRNRDEMRKDAAARAAILAALERQLKKGDKAWSATRAIAASWRRPATTISPSTAPRRKRTPSSTASSCSEPTA